MKDEDLQDLQVELKKVESFDELAMISAEALTSLAGMLYGEGVPNERIEQISFAIANMNKWFAAQYTQLFLEGKIPEEHIYVEGGK